ncbi:MAG: Gfo/Idh/MocA family oxidoreductase [candidate division WOR-3 bacterium]
MKDKVRVGIVGCGIQTQLIYLPALKKNKIAQVVSLCDTDLRKLNYLCNRFGIHKHFVDFEKFITDEEMDALIIATPNYLHCPMTIAALEYDKDVLVETPMAINYQEAKKMSTLAKKKKRILMPAIYQKIRQDVQMIKNFIDGGELGSIYYSKAGWLRGRAEWAMTGWWAEQMRAGGGAFLSLGTQILDIALYFASPEKPISIIGSAHKRSEKSQVEDSAFAFLRFPKSQILTIEVGFSVLQEKDFSYYNAFGDKGAALLNPVSINREMHGHLVNVTPKSILQQKDYVRQAYNLLVDLFIDGVSKDIELPISAEDGVVISKITDAFYKSCQTQKEVIIEK